MDGTLSLLIVLHWLIPVRTTHSIANITGSKTNIFSELAEGLLNLQQEH